MGIRKRIAQLETDNEALRKRADGLEKVIEALVKRLDELEPAIEQYKVSEEEAAAYEKTMNDGMASIFGYVTPGMRGNDHGGR